MALLISHKNLTLIMVASPLPWKVQWAHHGMGFVTINGEDRLAMFGNDSGMIVWYFTIPKQSNGKRQPWN